jgi:hypothetical protein
LNPVVQNSYLLNGKQFQFRNFLLRALLKSLAYPLPGSAGDTANGISSVLIYKKTDAACTQTLLSDFQFLCATCIETVDSNLLRKQSQNSMRHYR